MIALKPGVKVNGVQPELIMGILVANSVFEQHGIRHTVTSITDGRHGHNSLHYAGLAFDSRTWADDLGTQIPQDEKERLAEALREALGDEFDVVVEPTHIHIEFDPE